MTGQIEFIDALLDAKKARPEGMSDGLGQAAGRRFDVYRNNVAVSLGDALETAFPVIRKLLGDNNFGIVASVFLRKHPPTSPLMMFYGAGLPEFLETFQPTSTMGYLPDVARLELAIRESYHAADARPIDPSVFQAMSPDRLMASKVAIAPSVRVIQSQWPVHSIWRFNSQEEAPKPTMAAEDTLILRPEFDPLPTKLPEGAATFIASLQAGRTFGCAIDAASAEAAEFDLSETLTLLIGGGALTDIEV